MRVLYLDLDTLRPDHLGCYGYARDTSPNIDRLAAQGIRFDNYYCSDAPCLPSRAALITGQFGIHTGVVNHGGVHADLRTKGRDRGFRDALGAGQALPMVFRKAGLRTVSVSPFAERHSAWWFYAGFTEMLNTGRGGMESAEEVTPAALAWLRANAKSDNWFLHVNYWDPHTPYRAPAEFGNPFADTPLPAWLTAETLEKHRAAVGPHTAREIGMYDAAVNPAYPRHPGEIRDMNDLRRMMDGYDCGIRYMDGHIGRLLQALEEAGVMDDTAVIVSSDHGENQGELAIYGEHATADHITCRIPMIVRWPGGQRGRADSALRYNLDLAPTLAELFGQAPHPAWDGRSFAGAIARGEAAGHEHLVVSQCAHVCQRGVRFGPWLYMRTYHDGFHLWPEEMLYDLASDPHEQTDLAPQRPDVCREAAWRLMAWHDRMMRTMPEPHAEDPLWRVIRDGGPLHARGHLAKYCKRLEATDRGWAVPELKRRHPREFA
jgi:arylsulfatase A-like enzyme